MRDLPGGDAGVSAAEGGGALPDDVRGDVEAVLAAAFGGAVRVTAYARLSARLSPVSRVALAGPPGTPATAVVKHLPPGAYGDPAGGRAPPEFLEEAAAYALFEGLARPPFAERARRLAWHPRGALVLEDLGESDRGLAAAPVGDLVAVTLARLHAATLGRAAALAEARRFVGAAPDAHRGRYEGDAAVSRRFARGAAALGGWCDALAVAPAARVAGLLAAVEAAVAAPGPFHALIHDDLASARQCVVRDGRLLLLDWENAKYGHALRDVAKVLVGKFERHLETGEMLRVSPGMEPGMAARYRRELARAGGPAVDDAAWSDAWAAAVLFSTTVQVGMLMGLYGATPVDGAVLPNLASAVWRMGEVLHGLPGHDEIRGILAALAGRIL
jgi:hypothetical protein